MVESFFEISSRIWNFLTQNPIFSYTIGSIILTAIIAVIVKAIR